MTSCDHNVAGKEMMTLFPSVTLTRNLSNLEEHLIGEANRDVRYETDTEKPAATRFSIYWTSILYVCLFLLSFLTMNLVHSAGS